jgi:two-component system copper resistance phosphate regulon response regulator CusR
LELCRELRIRHPHTPVIMLTALGEVEDKVSAFDIGADDYLVKPFDFRELLVRIQACLKRTAKQQAPTESGIIQVADMQIDTQGKTVVRGNKQIVLTAKEFALLEFLARNEGKVISKPEIAEKVWDITFDTGTNVVEVYVNFLRKKIDKEFEPKLIHTRSGMGYVLRVDE